MVDRRYLLLEEEMSDGVVGGFLAIKRANEGPVEKQHKIHYRVIE